MENFDERLDNFLEDQYQAFVVILNQNINEMIDQTITFENMLHVATTFNTAFPHPSIIEDYLQEELEFPNTGNNFFREVAAYIIRALYRRYNNIMVTIGGRQVPIPNSITDHYFETIAHYVHYLRQRGYHIVRSQGPGPESGPNMPQRFDDDQWQEFENAANYQQITTQLEILFQNGFPTTYFRSQFLPAKYNHLHGAHLTGSGFGCQSKKRLSSSVMTMAQSKAKQNNY